MFWQWFLGAFGGFILKDYEAQEHKLLAQKASIPVEEVPRAFAAFDKLFPIEGGWFRESPYSNLRIFLLHPPPLAGVGSNYRRVLYTAEKKFENLTLTGMHTLRDLYKWNNSAVELLTN